MELHISTSVLYNLIKLKEVMPDLAITNTINLITLLWFANAEEKLSHLSVLSLDILMKMNAF